MIRTNLSTRPFYNERAVNLWVGVAALVVVGATAMNVSRVLNYSGSSTELSGKAAQDEARAAEVRGAAVRLRASVDTAQVDAAAVDARLANSLIDRRTFSWTDLFNRFEATLPDDVRITSVSPRPDREGHIVLTVVVVARSVDDVNQFMERLDSTGVFHELRSTQEQANDNGQIESVLQTKYLPVPTGVDRP